MKLYKDTEKLLLEIDRLPESEEKELAKKYLMKLMDALHEILLKDITKQ